MTRILSIDTSSEDCSVAIHQNGILLASSKVSVAKSHSSLLLTMIDQIVINSGISISDLDAFAYSEGPGSYTGLRIGLSTLKGLCFSIKKPLIGVGTLYLMAQHIKQYYSKEYLLMPIIDARRDEVYASLYSFDLEELIPPTPFILDQYFMNDFLEENKILFFGSGAEKTSNLITNPNSVFLMGISQSANDMGQIAYEYYSSGKFLDVVNCEPFYLKKFYTPTKSIKS